MSLAPLITHAACATHLRAPSCSSIPQCSAAWRNSHRRSSATAAHTPLLSPPSKHPIATLTICLPLVSCYRAHFPPRELLESGVRIEFRAETVENRTIFILRCEGERDQAHTRWRHTTHHSRHAASIWHSCLLASCCCAHRKVEIRMISLDSIIIIDHSLHRCIASFASSGIRLSTLKRIRLHSREGEC